MLIELTVRNLAIFEDVRVPFSAGLNVVTGETGAGKSLLVEAIRLALGEKADPMAVRTGEPEAEVTALFDLSRRDDLRDALEEMGLPWEEEVVLRRVLPAKPGLVATRARARAAELADEARIAAFEILGDRGRAIAIAESRLRAS